MLGFVDKRESQINSCLIQNRISYPDATLNQTPLGSQRKGLGPIRSRPMSATPTSRRPSIRRFQGLTDIGLMPNLIPGYLTIREPTFDTYMSTRGFTPMRPNQMRYWQNSTRSSSRLMILSTSAVAVCCCSASLSWRVRVATCFFHPRIGFPESLSS